MLRRDAATSVRIKEWLSERLLGFVGSARGKSLFSLWLGVRDRVIPRELGRAVDDVSRSSAQNSSPAEPEAVAKDRVAKPARSAKTLMSKAELAANSGDWATCRKLFDQAFAADPDVISTRHARLHIKASMKSDALDHCGSLIERYRTAFPSSLGLISDRAAWATARGDLALAISDLEHLYSRTPAQSKPPVAIRLIQALATVRRFGDAERICLDGGNISQPKIRFEYGEIAFRQGHIFEAAKRWRPLTASASSLPPSSISRLYAAFADIGWHDEAQALVKRVSEANPSSMPAQNLLLEQKFRGAIDQENAAVWSGKTLSEADWPALRRSFGALHAAHPKARILRSHRPQMALIYCLNSALVTGNKSEAEELLRSGLHDYGSGAQSAFFQLAPSLIDCLLSSDPRSPQAEEFVERLLQSDPRIAPVDGWLFVYTLLVAKGFFRAGSAARVHAREQAIATAGEADAVAKTVIRGIRASVDAGLFEQAFDLVRRDCIRQLRPDHANRISRFLAVQSGGSASQDASSQVDEAFRARVNGKRVAIVGPAPSVVPQGEEIESYDLVVRFNYRAPLDPSETHIYGSRTDLSYYNFEFFSNIYHQNGDVSFLSDLPSIAVKSVNYADVAATAAQGRCHIFERIDDLFNGGANALPSALNDLLSYGASDIKVFNSNFYSSATPYAASYLDRVLASVRNSSQTKVPFHSALIRARHDYLSQFHFVKNLWRAKGIDADEECGLVLGLSDSEYMASLERTSL